MISSESKVMMLDSPMKLLHWEKFWPVQQEESVYRQKSFPFENICVAIECLNKHLIITFALVKLEL